MFKRLKKIALFHGLPDEAIEDIAKLVQECAFEPDEVVIIEGDVSTARPDIFFLESGSVLVTVKYSPQEGTEDQILYDLHEQIYGELAWLLDSNRTARVVCTSKSLFLCLKGEKFYQYLYQNPSVGLVIMERIATILARRVIYLEEQVRDQALSRDFSLL